VKISGIRGKLLKYYGLNKIVIVVPEFGSEQTFILQSIAVAKSRIKCKPKPDLMPITSESS